MVSYFHLPALAPEDGVATRLMHREWLSSIEVCHAKCCVHVLFPPCVIQKSHHTHVIQPYLISLGMSPELRSVRYFSCVVVLTFSASFRGSCTVFLR
jgi:hypothetical protein